MRTNVNGDEMVTSLEDLSERLRLLKERGVREYRDGNLHIVFDREPKPLREVPVRGVQPESFGE